MSGDRHVGSSCYGIMRKIFRASPRELSCGKAPSFAVDCAADAVIDNLYPRRHYYVHHLAKETFVEIGGVMVQFFRNIWQDEQGQDIAEYAVMLAVILVLVIGTVRLIGTSANTVFSQAASSIQ
jgi:Flp pilus assembly pilin Flp